jgi:hypothetical protein
MSHDLLVLVSSLSLQIEDCPKAIGVDAQKMLTIA